MLYDTSYNTLTALIRSDAKFRDYDSNDMEVIYWTS